MSQDKFTENKSMDDMGQPEIPPGHIPLYDFDGSLLNTMYPYNSYPTRSTINKIYNISLSDPLGNHTMINRVYEDTLPGDSNIYTFIRLQERETIKKSLRSSILQNFDGEELTIKGGDNSLLSWFKIYDLNPYSLKRNPYETLPTGFMIYRSAYPIRYNRDTHSLKTLQSSLAFNIRLYELSIGSLLTWNTVNRLDEKLFNVWRDVIYYRHINNIIEKKISPNFINMVFYVKDSKSSIPYKEIDNIKRNKLGIDNTVQRNNDNILNTIKVIKTSELLNSLHKLNDDDVDPSALNLPFRKCQQQNVPLLKIPDVFITQNIRNLIEKNDVVDLTAYSNENLVIVTEAPNTNILQWNKKLYEEQGTVKRMTSTGYHNMETWKSVLFQLLYACAVLEREEIYFNNFSLENNVYIKDVTTDKSGKNCWLYKVNGIDYYVPNYGYIVVIDTNFVDINSYKPNEYQYKTYGKIYEGFNYNDIIENNFKLKIRKAVMQMMTVNAFKKFGGNDFDNNVSDILNMISDKIPKTNNLIDVLPCVFQSYFHNKIGTVLTNQEKDNFTIFNRPNMVRGNMLIRRRRYDDYDWVMFKENQGNNKIIIFKEGNNYVEKSVFPSCLFSYPEIIKPEGIVIIDTYTY